MNIFEAIIMYLLTKASLTSLVGQNVFAEYSTQVTPKPFINFTCHDVERVIHLGGASASGDFYVQFDIYANSTSSRLAVGEALRNILHCRTNIALTDSNSNTCNLEFSELKRDILGTKSPYDGTENGIFCRTMSFRMVIDEPKPTLS